jgi:hypothetical protein
MAAAVSVVLVTTTASAQHVITVPHDRPKAPTAVEDRSQQLHIKRGGTNERIDMYPGMIWRYEAPVAIKHVHIGDEDLVFVQPGENDHVVYIGAFNKTGGNVRGNDSNAGSTTMIAQSNNSGDNNATEKNGDKQGGKTGGQTNVILLDDGDEPIANIEIQAWPYYLREDEGHVVRILRDGRYDTYQCRNKYYCPQVPTWLPVPK